MGELHDAEYADLLHGTSDGGYWSTETTPAYWDTLGDLIRPPNVTGAGFAFDSVRGVAVLFGGVSPESEAPYNATWTWDGRHWRQVGTFIVPPAGLVIAMAFDSARGVMVLFGPGNTQETWEFDGSTWQKRTPPEPLPPGGAGGSMAYDAAARRMVLLAGGDGGSDTWAWDGTRWERTGSARPGTIGYAGDRQKLVLLTKGPAPELFEFNGSDGGWGRVSSAMHDGQLFFDPDGKRLVISRWGVFSTWDGNTWQEIGRAPTGVPAFDQTRRTMIYHGGQRWDRSTYEAGPLVSDAGMDYAVVAPLTPPPVGPAAFDSDRAVIVQVSGGKTWEWNGLRWGEVDVGVDAGAFGPADLAYDQSRHVLVGFAPTGIWERAVGHWEKVELDGGQGCGGISL